MGIFGTPDADSAQPLMPSLAEALARDPRYVLGQSIISQAQQGFQQPSYSKFSGLAKALTEGIGGLTTGLVQRDYQSQNAAAQNALAQALAASQPSPGGIDPTTGLPTPPRGPDYSKMISILGSNPVTAPQALQFSLTQAGNAQQARYNLIKAMADKGLGIQTDAAGNPVGVAAIPNYGSSVASIAGATKGAEADAQNQSDLRFKPQTAAATAQATLPFEVAKAGQEAWARLPANIQQMIATTNYQNQFEPVTIPMLQPDGTTRDYTTTRAALHGYFGGGAQQRGAGTGGLPGVPGAAAAAPAPQIGQPAGAPHFGNAAATAGFAQGGLPQSVAASQGAPAATAATVAPGSAASAAGIPLPQQKPPVPAMNAAQGAPTSSPAASQSPANPAAAAAAGSSITGLPGIVGQQRMTPEQEGSSKALGDLNEQIISNEAKAPKTLGDIQILRTAAQQAFTPGATGATRAAFYRTAADVMRGAGMTVPDSVQAAATGADVIDKIGGQMTTDIVRSLGTREALGIYQAVGRYMPNTTMSQGGYGAVLSSLEQGAQRDADLGAFRRQWLAPQSAANPYGGHNSVDGMMAAFEKTYPIQAYASRVWPMPMPSAKADAIPNVIYSSPKGPVLWDGSLFRPVQ